MKIKIPKIKKKISNYLLSEEGKISKQALLTMGAFLGGAALGGILSSQESHAINYDNDPSNGCNDLTIPTSSAVHCNSLTLSYSAGTATATHAHHASY
ncbi:MAG: hypothetical protein ABIC04_01725 [Nanoarchaeota archaeon]